MELLKWPSFLLNGTPCTEELHDQTNLLDPNYVDKQIPPGLLKILSVEDQRIGSEMEKSKKALASQLYFKVYNLDNSLILNVLLEQIMLIVFLKTLSNLTVIPW